MQAHRNGQPWSREDLERLRQLAGERRSVNAIADILGRTPIGIRSKAISLGLRLGARSNRSPVEEPAGLDVEAGGRPPA